MDGSWFPGDRLAATAYVNRVGTAVPPNDVPQAFIDFAGRLARGTRERRLFTRMVDRAGILHRYSHLCPDRPGGSTLDTVPQQVGNVSSATLPFVLARILADPMPRPGLAITFGPGLVAESFRSTLV